MAISDDTHAAWLAKSAEQINAARKRIAELEAVLDDIHIQGIERAAGWMMVPKVEWDQAFERAKLKK